MDIVDKYFGIRLKLELARAELFQYFRVPDTGANRHISTIMNCRGIFWKIVEATYDRVYLSENRQELVDMAFEDDVYSATEFMLISPRQSDCVFHTGRHTLLIVDDTMLDETVCLIVSNHMRVE